MPPMEPASDEEGTVSDGSIVEPEMDGGMGRWMEPMQSRLTPELEEETSRNQRVAGVAGGGGRGGGGHARPAGARRVHG
eukprot:4179620-Prymnesium_polylepis.1